MTNTLHRHGSREGLRNDFVVFALPCRGRNDQDSVPKLREFLRRAAKYNPVNMGNGARGAIFRPNKKLNPLAHWIREEKLFREDVIEGVAKPSTVAAVFDNKEAVVNLIRELREIDLGLSVNVSALIDEAKECCQSASLRRHSVEYSLRGMGKTERMAEERVLELSMMCGHGMISFNFSRKMIDWVRQGRRTPDQAGQYLGRLCTCGIFNPARASKIFNKSVAGGDSKDRSVEFKLPCYFLRPPCRYGEREVERFMVGKAGKQRPKLVACHRCRHYKITWEKSHPYACRAHGFKSKKNPSLAVYEASALPCQLFAPKE